MADPREMIVKELIVKISGLSDEDFQAVTKTASRSKISEDVVRLIYKEDGDQIRHFSTVRSALTTFLVTVSLAAFSAYFNTSQSAFFVAAGLIFSGAALIACLSFSYRCENTVLRYKKMWTYLRTADAINFQALPGDSHSWKDVLGRMVRDPMNWLLVVGDALLVLAFVKRDQLQVWLQSFGLL